MSWTSAPMQQDENKVLIENEQHTETMIVSSTSPQTTTHTLQIKIQSASAKNTDVFEIVCLNPVVACSPNVILNTSGTPQYVTGLRNAIGRLMGMLTRNFNADLASKWNAAVRSGRKSIELTRLAYGFVDNADAKSYEQIQANGTKYPIDLLLFGLDEYLKRRLMPIYQEETTQHRGPKPDIDVRSKPELMSQVYRAMADAASQSSNIIENNIHIVGMRLMTAYHDLINKKGYFAPSAVSEPKEEQKNAAIPEAEKTQGIEKTQNPLIPVVDEQSIRDYPFVPVVEILNDLLGKSYNLPGIRIEITDDIIGQDRGLPLGTFIFTICWN